MIRHRITGNMTRFIPAYAKPSALRKLMDPAEFSDRPAPAFFRYEDSINNVRRLYVEDNLNLDGFYYWEETAERTPFYSHRTETQDPPYDPNCIYDYCAEFNQPPSGSEQQE